MITNTAATPAMITEAGSVSVRHADDPHRGDHQQDPGELRGHRHEEGAEAARPDRVAERDPEPDEGAFDIGDRAPEPAQDRPDRPLGPATELARETLRADDQDQPAAEADEEQRRPAAGTP